MRNESLGTMGRAAVDPAGTAMGELYTRYVPAGIRLAYLLSGDPDRAQDLAHVHDVLPMCTHTVQRRSKQLRPRLVCAAALAGDDPRQVPAIHPYRRLQVLVVDIRHHAHRHASLAQFVQEFSCAGTGTRRLPAGEDACHQLIYVYRRREIACQLSQATYFNLALAPETRTVRRTAH